MYSVTAQGASAGRSGACDSGGSTLEGAGPSDCHHHSVADRRPHIPTPRFSHPDYDRRLRTLTGSTALATFCQVTP